MKLQKEPFEAIKAGKKTVEMRLNDEKRRKINISDIIEFQNMESLEVIKVKVIELLRYNSFKELYDSLDKTILGYAIDETAHYTDMEKYYSKEEIEKYGVLGIRVQLI